MRIMTAVRGFRYGLGTAPVISYGVFGLLIAWTVAYGSAMRRKYAAPAVAATAA